MQTDHDRALTTDRLGALGHLARTVPLAAFAVVLLWSSTAAASEPHRERPAKDMSCGDTIMVDTRLTNDLHDCPGNGLVVGADHITLDLAGHTIDGNGIADASGVLSVGFDGVTVRGGAVRDFAEGVALLDANGGRIREMSFTNHSHVAVFVMRSVDVTIERNTVVDTTFAGIFAGDSHGTRIERNTSSSNGAGIAVGGGEGARITGNTLSGNTFVGILVEADGTRVDHNQIDESGTGVMVFATRATIADNNVDHAIGCLPFANFEECVAPPPGDCPDCIYGAGISVEGGASNLVARNDVRRTKLDGIRVGTFDPGNATVDTVIRDNHVRDATLDGHGPRLRGDCSPMPPHEIESGVRCCEHPT
jgi:parallel beta-helix repeat protein